jgi:hypothetical protein
MGGSLARCVVRSPHASVGPGRPIVQAAVQVTAANCPFDKFSSSRLPPLCLRHVLPDQQARRCPIRSTLVVEPVKSQQPLWIEVFLRIGIDLLVARNRLPA